MSERVVVQDENSRSATTNPLGERINRYQSIGWTLRSGTGIVISQRAPLDLLWGKCYEEDDGSDFLLLVLSSTKSTRQLLLDP
jgi:hypothetical protein